MARNFVVASNQFINFPSLNSVLGTVYTGAIRFKTPTITDSSERSLLGHRRNQISSTPILFLVRITTTGAIEVIVTDDVGDGLSDSANSLVSANIWQTAIFTRNGTTIEMFLDGVSSGGSTNVDLGTIANSELFDVGAVSNGISTTRTQFFEGDLAEAAIWSVELTQAEIDSYHGGMNPLLIQPSNLEFYAPLYGNSGIPDLSGTGNTGTNNGSTVSGFHAPVGKLVKNKVMISYLTVSRVETVNEALNQSEAIEAIFSATPVLTEALNNSESLSNLLTALHTLTDIVQSLDAPQVGWEFLINESLNYSESQIVKLVIPLLDQLFFSESDRVGGTYGTILKEILELLDFPLTSKLFADTIAESLNYSDTLIDLHKKVAVILDLLNIKENILNTGTFGHFLADELNLLESLERLFRETISEVFNLSELLDERVIFLTSISENFNVSEVIAEVFSASTIVTDTFQGTDSVGNQITFFVLSNDKIIFRSEIVVSGHAFACWVLTTKEYNPSVYSNFDFNSYARLENKLYGARQDGIYLLEGSDDSGSEVHTGLLFDFANMDIPATKRLRSIHLGSKTKQATVQVTTDRGITKTYITKQQRTVVGKEVRGKYWTVAVEDVDNLKSMELNVVLISKKR